MILQLILALALDPTAQTQTPVDAPAVVRTETREETDDDRRLRRIQEREGAITCQNRARTGDRLNRNICRTERRARVDRQAAQDYIGGVTNGSANQEVPLTPIP